jgi:L-cysteine S-thiosulfotransferase
MVRKHHRRHVRLIALCGLAAAQAAAPADLQRGIAVVIDARKGNCVICHSMPIDGMPAEAFGNLGPALAGVGSRLTPDAIRRRIVDPRAASPDTIMPAYAVSTGLYRVQRAYVDRPILTAQEIEDVVAYLSSLK